MRILANFTKKVSTGQFENETYTVTVETDTEGAFNNIAEVSDYLFNQARTAVQRQLDGTASSEIPRTTTPGTTSGNGAGQEANNRKPRSGSNGNGNGQFKATEKQVNMLRKLFDENFSTKDEARAWLRQQCNLDSTANLNRKQASMLIEKLIDKSRSVV